MSNYTKKDIIDRYIGIPFKHLGRSLDGLDCHGLLLDFCKHFRDIELPDPEGGYTENWSFEGKNYFLDRMAENWDRTLTPSLGDIVLLCNSNGIINHGGVMLNEREFIHACKAGVTIGRVRSPHWKSKISGFWRYGK